MITPTAVIVTISCILLSILAWHAFKRILDRRPVDPLFTPPPDKGSLDDVYAELSRNDADFKAGRITQKQWQDRARVLREYERARDPYQI